MGRCGRGRRGLCKRRRHTGITGSRRGRRRNRLPVGADQGRRWHGLGVGAEGLQHLRLELSLDRGKRERVLHILFVELALPGGGAL